MILPWKFLTHRMGFVLMLAIAALVGGSHLAGAIDIFDVEDAALDQPQINIALEAPGASKPYIGTDIGGIKTFNISAFLDTGSSGMLISKATADALGLPTAPGVTFSDVGVGGSDKFNVSEPVVARIAPTTAVDVDNLNTYKTVYNQVTGPVRTQVGPVPPPIDDLLGGLDIAGMPAMIGKVVVMDPKPVNDLSDQMHTYIYNPGTRFHAGTPNTDPGIPQTSHHVALSYASFDQFTQISPSGAAAPNFSHSPFIGPTPAVTHNAQALVAPDSTPPISLDFLGHHATGSFLFDSGAATSFISSDLAAQLHVRYVEGTFGGNDPKLEIFDPANPGVAGTPVDHQFQLAVGGIGGSITAAGFYLDDLIVHTKEGSLLESDPNNFRWMHAPVLINDITLLDPKTNDTLTLDGVFGVNYYVASVLFHSDGTFDGGTTSPFNWVVFDEQNGILGLDYGPAAVPEPSTLVLAAIGLAALGAHVLRGRRRRA
jgi:hypothetical protein